MWNSPYLRPSSVVHEPTESTSFPKAGLQMGVHPEKRAMRERARELSGKKHKDAGAPSKES